MANEKKLINDPKDTAENGSNASQNRAKKALGSALPQSGAPETMTQQGAAPSYDANTDYQAKINEAVAVGNYGAAAGYEQQRNAKIQGEGLDYEQSHIYEPFLPQQSVTPPSPVQQSGGQDYIPKILGSVDRNDPNSIYHAYEQLIAQPGNVTDLTEYLNALYDANLKRQQSELMGEYAGYNEALDAQAKKAEEAAQQNMTRAAVESQQAQKAWAEAQNAYGLSSGAQGQAALARSNQLQSDVTAIRTAQQAALAGIEQQRTTYKQQYEAALREAAASNDYQRAQALYQEAVRQDEALKAQQAQINEWALGYLSNLGSAASYRGSTSYRGSGSRTGQATPTGGLTGSNLTLKELDAIRDLVLQGDNKRALAAIELYGGVNAIGQTGWDYVWGDIDPYAADDVPNGYTGEVPPGRQYGGIVSKGRDARLN